MYGMQHYFEHVCYTQDTTDSVNAVTYSSGSHVLNRQAIARWCRPVQHLALGFGLSGSMLATGFGDDAIYTAECSLNRIMTKPGASAEPLRPKAQGQVGTLNPATPGCLYVASLLISASCLL